MPAKRRNHLEIITGVETGQNQGIGKPQDGVFALTVPFAKGSIAVQVKVIGEPISPTDPASHAYGNIWNSLNLNGTVANGDR